MKLIIALACVFFMVQGHQAKKLEIEVLYESLCPDSLRFVINQLTPIYPEIKNYVKITYVPFGKAHYSDNQQEFVCQHGPSECQGNLVQSCVLQALTDQQLQVDYVDCFMRSYYDNPVDDGQKCATQAGVHWELVKQCVESNVGKSLQMQAQNVTHSYAPKFIPTVVYNKNFDQEAQDKSIHGFRDLVCTLIQKTNPEACASVSLV